jgi:hypothetical protein
LSSLTLHPKSKLLMPWHVHIFGLTGYADERLDITQTILCQYPPSIVSDLQFSFMWGHTNLFVPIPSIVMWPSILIHVRSHKPFCAHMVNCYVTFKSHWGKTLSRHIHK